jgi:nitrous oxide reductase accessory protein NosL
VRAALALALLLAACADKTPPDVPYQPADYQMGQVVTVAYDCPGVKAGTKLVFASMDGRDVRAWTADARVVTMDRRCVA